MRFWPRFDFPFTEHDTVRLRLRIERDLTCITNRVRDADPHVVALVLTGGFSRGEGTAREDAPVNDYDLLAVRARPGGARLYRGIAQRLSERVGLEVDIMPIWRARLPLVGRKLFWLDVRLGARVLAGEPLILRDLPRFGPESMAPGEIARLLGNRAAGLLLSLPTPNEPADPRQRDLQATKAVLAAMDALLLHDGRYAASMRARLAMMRDHPDHKAFATAVEWKLRGAKLPDDWWRDARDTLLRAVDSTMARYAKDDLAAHALHLLRAKRLAPSPSQDVRRRAWDLLAVSTWPDGPAGVMWGSTKPAFFAARARTLQ